MIREGAKPVPLVVADLFWKPFEARFDELLEKLRLHQDMVKDEVTIATYMDMKRTSNEEKRLHAEDRLRAAETRLAAKQTQRENEETRKRLYKSTRGNILDTFWGRLSPNLNQKAYYIELSNGWDLPNSPEILREPKDYANLIQRSGYFQSHFSNPGGYSSLMGTSPPTKDWSVAFLQANRVSQRTCCGSKV